MPEPPARMLAMADFTLAMRLPIVLRIAFIPSPIILQIDDVFWDSSPNFSSGAADAMPRAGS